MEESFWYKSAIEDDHLDDKKSSQVLYAGFNTSFSNILIFQSNQQQNFE